MILYTEEHDLVSDAIITGTNAFNRELERLGIPSADITPAPFLN